MMRTLKRRITRTTLAMAAICLLLFSCRQTHPIPHAARSIYYWKTTYKLTPEEKDFLKRHHIKKMYLRFFDIAKQSNEAAHPEASLIFNERLPKDLEIIPTVFIVENCMRDSTKALAKKVVKRILKMVSANNIKHVKEVQFDCDFTKKSRTKYYEFLLEARRLLREKGLHISATIRLHQLSMPTPPIDYGVLMVYNTGDPTKRNGHNPILDMRDIDPYLKSIKHYSLPLCAAYPIFGWRLFFNGTQFKGVIHQQNPRLKFVNDTIINWRCTAQDILKVKERIGKQIPCINNQVILYDLDTKNIKNYEEVFFENIYGN